MTDFECALILGSFTVLTIIVVRRWLKDYWRNELQRLDEGPVFGRRINERNNRA